MCPYIIICNIHYPAPIPPLTMSVQLPMVMYFLRRTGLGFHKNLRDRLLDECSEVKGLDVGVIGPLGLDLDC